MPGKVSPSSEEQERSDALKPLETPGPSPTEAPSSWSLTKTLEFYTKNPQWKLPQPKKGWLAITSLIFAIFVLLLFAGEECMDGLCLLPNPDFWRKISLGFTTIRVWNAGKSVEVNEGVAIRCWQKSHYCTETVTNDTQKRWREENKHGDPPLPTLLGEKSILAKASRFHLLPFPLSQIQTKKPLLEKRGLQVIWCQHPFECEISRLEFVCCLNSCIFSLFPHFPHAHRWLCDFSFKPEPSWSTEKHPGLWLLWFFSPFKCFFKCHCVLLESD